MIKINIRTSPKCINNPVSRVLNINFGYFFLGPHLVDELKKFIRLKMVNALFFLNLIGIRR